MYTREEVVAAARNLIDVPYVHQARSAVAGVDCAGLLKCVLVSLGEDPPDFLNYGKLPRPEVLMKYARAAMIEINPKDAGPGDVLALWMEGPGMPQHFVILSDGGTIIHALAKWKMVKEHTFPPRMRRRVCASFRFKGLIVEEVA